MIVTLTVLDRDTSQPVQGAVVDVHETRIRTSTNVNGRAVINAPVGMFTVTVNYGGRYTTVAMKTRSVTPIRV